MFVVLEVSIRNICRLRCAIHATEICPPSHRLTSPSSPFKRPTKKRLPSGSPEGKHWEQSGGNDDDDDGEEEEKDFHIKVLLYEYKVNLFIVHFRIGS